MKTELNIVPHEIIPGKKIDCEEHKIANFRMHQIGEQICRLMPYLLECDTNNTNATAVPRDVRKVRLQFSAIEKEIEFARAHNDTPQASHEMGYLLYLISQKEIQKIKNVKLKRVASEMYNMFKVFVTFDSAHTQSFVSDVDNQDLNELMAVVKDAMDLWLGEGKDSSDVGLSVPDFKRLGTISPDVDGDFAQVSEPSSEGHAPAIPDVADV